MESVENAAKRVKREVRSVFIKRAVTNIITVSNFIFISGLRAMFQRNCQGPGTFLLYLRRKGANEGNSCFRRNDQ